MSLNVFSGRRIDGRKQTREREGGEKVGFMVGIETDSGGAGALIT